MRKGKMVAQGAHAWMRAILNGARREGDVLCIPLDEPWLCGRFKKICVSVDSESELLKLHQQALDAGLITALIRDAGLTEFGGVPTYTALAIGPDEDAKIDELTKNLPLL